MPFFRFTLLLLGLILLAGFQISSPAADTSAWAEVKDTDLKIAPGSVLDFSRQFGTDARPVVVPLGVDGQGHLALRQGKGPRLRLLGATLLFGGPHGPLPDHRAADELAGQLRMHGYNLVRFHYIDEALMEGRSKDFDYDPQALDRFYYLLSALKQQGIYWMLDAATSENGVYAQTNAPPSGAKRNLRLELHIKPAAQDHWKKMVVTLLGKTNPYTKQRILADPALAMITVMNESGLEYLTRYGYQEELRKPFQKWLRKKYKSSAALRAAWPNVEVSSIGDIMLPDEGEISPRVTDLLRFFSDLERSTLHWTTGFLRKQGYKGLVTNYNNGVSVYSRTIGQDLKLVTQHGYYDHPSRFIQPGSEEKGISSIEEIVPYARDFASSRYAGKPFFIDEYDHPFWSPWRREAGIVIPAYAALQGWDGIARFANPVELEYGTSEFQRHTLINPFGIGMDPVARAGETLAALLFRRADVRQAQSGVVIDLATQSVYAEGGGRGRPMPDDLSSIGLVTGLGLRWNSAASKKIAHKKTGLAFALDPESSGYLKSNADKIAAKFDNEKSPFWTERIDELRAAGILPKQNRTDSASGIYQSDTGEITLETRARRMSVITPNTEAAVFDQGLPLTLQQVKVESASSPALIAVSAVDGRRLADSERILLIVATDALNSDMRFSNGRSMLHDLGTPPIRILTARITLTLQHNAPQGLRLYSTALNGMRMDAIPTEAVAGGLSFTLDTGSLSHGPTTYFELVKEQGEKQNVAVQKQ